MNKSHKSVRKRKSTRKSSPPRAGHALAHIADGRVRLERLPSTSKISARARIGGRQIRKSTGTRNLREAKRIALDWWVEMSGRVSRGEIVSFHIFGDCVSRFLDHQRTRADRGLISVNSYEFYRDKASKLSPILDAVRLTDIDVNYLESVRESRTQERSNRGTLVSNNTIRKDFIYITAVLKYAITPLGWLTTLPKRPEFSGTSAVVDRGRPFLTFDEYTRLWQIAKDRINEEGLNPRARRQRQHLLWFILIAVGGALRVGELDSVRWRDCSLVSYHDGRRKRTAVRMKVLGKHSKGAKREDAYVLFRGADAYAEMLKQRPPDSTQDDRLFRESTRDGMRELLKAAGLYEYRDPDTDTMITRDRKSLRPTGITMRLDFGNGLTHRDIAKWARTSPDMVMRYYDQAHPGSTLDRIGSFTATATRA